MNTTGVTALDNSMQTTNIWLNEILESMQWSDRQRAYAALRIVLKSLRDRLTVEEAADLAAQLPLMVRGIYYEGWHPAGKPVKEGRDAFLQRVQSTFKNGDHLDAEQVSRTVLGVLSKHVSSGEIKDVKCVLPQDLAELWP